MHQSVDVLPVEDERVVLDEAFEFEIPCDGPRIWPERIAEHIHPARWIGLKECGHHRLLCDECKEFYLDLMTQSTAFTCGECGGVVYESRFIGFELINRARQ